MRLALVCLLLLACSAAPQPAPGRPRAARLELQDAYSRPVRFEPGQERTLLVFWSCTWDPNAVAVWKMLKELDHKIVVVAYDEKPAALKKFLKGHPAPFPVALGNAQAYDSYAIDSLPTLILVDETGTIVLRTVGVPDLAELKKDLAHGN